MKVFSAKIKKTKLPITLQAGRLQKKKSQCLPNEIMKIIKNFAKKEE
jgi:hypothetical protein